MAVQTGNISDNSKLSMGGSIVIHYYILLHLIDVRIQSLCSTAHLFLPNIDILISYYGHRQIIHSLAWPFMPIDFGRFKRTENSRPPCRSDPAVTWNMWQSKKEFFLFCFSGVGLS